MGRRSNRRCDLRSVPPAGRVNERAKRAVTADILTKVLQVCAGERTVDLRDRACF